MLARLDGVDGVDGAGAVDGVDQVCINWLSFNIIQYH